MHHAKIITHVSVGQDLSLLTLDRVDPAYTLFGQYLTATVGAHKPAFLAIASAPGRPLQLLIRATAGTAGQLVSTQVGDSLLISDAMGPGFGTLPDGPRLLLLNGSGLSAVRALVQAEVDAHLPHPIHLYLGVQTEAHIPLRSELDAWAAAGVQLTVVASRPGPDWRGPTGHVQDRAEVDGLCRDDVVVVMVGYPAMLEDVRRRWGAVGCSALHANF